MKKSIAFVLMMVVLASAFAQKFEHLAPTPPMGWNSWNTFQTKIDEQLVKQTADILVSSGMKDAGYTYLVLDDGWMAMERDSAGNLVPDPVKFPNGIKPVIDYVHSIGLKFGLYNDAGTKTCAGYPGTRGYEYQDARNYAAWGIDYLKFDWCYADGENAPEAYSTMSKAIKKAGRPIVFSLCEWGTHQPWQWAAPIGHLWRTTGDIYQIFDSTQRINNQFTALGVMHIVDMQDSIRKYAGPDHWNDPDMLEVGNGMKESEDRAHFSMWCMLAAPLMSGNDLRKMSPSTISILTNRDAIAIDQDPLGIGAFRYARNNGLDTWIRPLSNNEWAICFVNRSPNARQVQFDWKSKPIEDTLSHRTLDASTATYKLRDVWTKKDMGNTSKPFVGTVPSHDVIMLRISR